MARVELRGVVRCAPSTTGRFPRCSKWHCSVTFVVGCLLLGRALAGPVQLFHVQHRSYVAYLSPHTYEGAVASCADSVLLGGRPASLLSVALLTDLLSAMGHDIPDEAKVGKAKEVHGHGRGGYQLCGTHLRRGWMDPDYFFLRGSPLGLGVSACQELRQALADVAANSPPEQRSWSMWTWDEYRVCRAAKLGPGADGFVATTDRPCAWRLPYICAEEAVVRAAGVTSSTTWHRRHFGLGALVPLPPSPFTLGPGPSPGRSGLVLLRSGLIVGGDFAKLLLPDGVAAPSSLTVPFDDSERFWSGGPVVSALYRSGSGKLMTLRLLREREVDDGWDLYSNQTSIDPGDVMGAMQLALDDGPAYELYNVGPYQDYVVAIEGCFRSFEVESLALVTRTGRRYQMGRGGCSNWFREDAPPGGYLAGLAGRHLDLERWKAVPWYSGETPYERTWLNQVQPVWAAPAGSPIPVYTVRRLPLLSPSAAPACPGANAQAERLYDNLMPTACNSRSRVCPSNSCCRGLHSMVEKGIRRDYQECSSGAWHCLSFCASDAGLCNVVPEKALLQFVAAAPPLPTPTLTPPQQQVQQQQSPTSASAPGELPALAAYVIDKDSQLSYNAAVRYCAGSSFMGLAWSLISSQDSIDWMASLETRRDAFAALSRAGYFWVAAPEAQAADPFPSAGGSRCIRGAFGLLPGSDIFSHSFWPSSCADANAVVVCKARLPAAARPQPASSAVAAAVVEARSPLADYGLLPASAFAFVPASALAVGNDGGSTTWAPGPHHLTTSIRRYGGGPYLNTELAFCSFALGTTAAAANSYPNAATAAAITSNTTSSSGGGAPSLNSTSGSAGFVSGARATAPTVTARTSVVAMRQVAAIGVSVAAQLGNSTDNVVVVSGLRMRYFSDGDVTGGSGAEASAVGGAGGSAIGGQAGAAAGDGEYASGDGGGGADEAWETAGAASSGGWHSLDLAAGEVVVAVSGCVGGFLERLVFHTSAGRLWTHPLLAASLCSASFLEVATPGSYLLGLQGSYGYHIESLQLVWGVPAVGTGANSKPTASVPSPLESSGSEMLQHPAAGAPASRFPPAVQHSTLPPAGEAAAFTAPAPYISAGVIAGAVVCGAVGAAAVIGVLVVALLRWRRRRGATGQELRSSRMPPPPPPEKFKGEPAVRLMLSPLAGGGGSSTGGVSGKENLVQLAAEGDDVSNSSPVGDVIAPTMADANAVLAVAAVVSAAAELAAIGLPAGRSRRKRLGATGSSTVSVSSGSEGTPNDSGALRVVGDWQISSGSDSQCRGGGGCDDGNATPRSPALLLDTPPLWPRERRRFLLSSEGGNSIAPPPAGPMLLRTASRAATATRYTHLSSAASRLRIAYTAGCDRVAVAAVGLEEQLSAYIQRTGESVLGSAAAGSAEIATANDAGPACAVGLSVDSEAEADAGIPAAITQMHATLIAGRRGELRVSAVLGRGAFGVVYLGTWRGLRVAVKTLVLHDTLMGQQARQRHRAILEAAISKSLQHPNCVCTYDAEVVPLTAAAASQPPAATQQQQQEAAATRGEDEARCPADHPGNAAAEEGLRTSTGRCDADTGDVYKLLIIQEYCSVGSLAAALGAGVVGSVAAGGVAALCALTLALDVACGMQYIHSRNIVHGDLSPANVLLASSGGSGGVGAEEDATRQPLAELWRPPITAKVADFGLSVHIREDQTHVSNRFQGTPGYAAPEVLARGRLSSAADVWAFGVLLLELAHGQRIKQVKARIVAAAATAATAAAAAAASGQQASGGHGGSSGQPVASWSVPPANSPPRVVALVTACLSPDPSARPSFDKIVEFLVMTLSEEHGRYQWQAATAAAMTTGEAGPLAAAPSPHIRRCGSGLVRG